MAKPTKITKAGVYDLPMSVYHGDCCDGPSISSSGLRTIELECPLEYWAFSYLNKNAYPQDDKPAWSFGRAAHCLLLGDSVFEDHFVVRPEEWKDWRKKDAKEWRDEQIGKGKSVLIPDELVLIEQMAAVLAKHPLSRDLLTGEVEKSMLWKDEETGVWLKSRPDIIPTFDNVVVDYKTTTQRVRPYQLQQDITKYGYHMQLALMEDGMRILLGKDDLNIALVFQQKKPPFHVTWVEVTPAFLELGRMQNRKALRTFADCLEKGEWPGYADGIVQAHPPEWLIKSMEDTD